MVALVLLTALVLVASIAVTRRMRSRAEAVIAASLVFNALVIAPIYLLGLTGHLTRGALAFAAVIESLVLLTLALRGEDVHGNVRALLRRVGSLAFLPFDAIRRTWQTRSLLTVGATLSALLFPYMIVVSYLAPAWRDWDTLWYHEPITGFTIQNHGFAVVPLPPPLQGVNGVHRLCEMTQLWFAIYGGRRVIELGNVVFMPLLVASVFALARRYTRDIVTSVAVACALMLMPGFLRLVQTTMVDPQSAALLLAAAYFVTQPKLDRHAAFFGILGLTLAAGAKIWSVVPIGLLSLYVLVRILRRTRSLGRAWSALAVLLGAAAVLGMQAVTYLRNWLHFHNPLWPTVAYDNPKWHIHWPGALPVDPQKPGMGISINDPFDVFYRKMTSAPFTAMGPGHSWQVNDYGFPWAWVVLPLCALAMLVVFVRWLESVFATTLRFRRSGPSDELVSGTMILALCAFASLALTPALFIARYHIPSVGMMLGCLCWMAGAGRGKRLVADAALFAQLGALLLAYWVPRKMTMLYLYDAAEIAHWLKTPYPEREVMDLKGGQMISPIVGTTGLAREKELGPGDVVGFDYLDYPALLWNNDFSNRVVWLQGNDPLAEANRVGAKWIYTRNGTTLHGQIAHPGTGWQWVGVLEAEGAGNVFRRVQ
ncbi:MAG: hypothetical protein JWP97_6215 [Labilithrix sp.]|nr:hypothetical protein [Labilithrix sp.]